MLIFVYLQPQEKPTMTMDTVQPIIYSPGLGMRPYMSDKKYTNEFSPLIEFKKGDKESYSDYTTSIAKFLKSYKNASDFTIKDCHSDKKSSCPVKLSRLGPCSGLSDKSYGYDSGKPCVLLKINKIYGWKPEAYDKSPYKKLGSHWSTNSIAVHCQKYEVHGDGSDAKNPSWSVELHPPDGFPFSCFPFCNKQKYVAPLIMAQFKNLPPDEEVNVWCRAFAKNIQLDKRDRAGAVRFTLRLNS
ncbi:hypothetical protein NP493_29g00017 [Ridgeia piscesae]|uniref:Sodium/potassium-transporting ATPase subunit beta n=1 Tax=Ridgeia piscesae TaxID=27915 RepID=A0AAD9PCW9_RIDPI|nr:hypothetical protein NP493_29g00017 [Ridgeia piscesae]